jgi:hypothetical protein
MIRTAADPVAAFCELDPTYGKLIGAGVKTIGALISILDKYHGDDGIIVSFSILGGMAPVPIPHPPLEVSA